MKTIPYYISLASFAGLIVCTAIDSIPGMLACLAAVVPSTFIHLIIIKK